MKNIMNNLLNWLQGFGKDKYQHFTVGALLAAAGFLAALPFGALWWIALLVSMIVVVTAALIKERKIDPQADMQDVLWTLYGGAAVWSTAIVIHIMK